MKPWKESAKTKKFCILTLVGIFLVVGIPIIINELYKANKGYITVWYGADVLSYYGTILGAIATIWVLGSTISFTRRQLRYDRYLENELGKWKNIEHLCKNALDNIQPIKLNELYLTIISQQKNNLMNPDFTLYAVNAKTALSIIKYNINENDRAFLQDFLNPLEKLCFEVCEIAGEFQQVLEEMRRITTKYNEAVTKNYLTPHADHASLLIAKTNKLQENDYTTLLQLKLESFTKIYAMVEENAKKLI